MPGTKSKGISKKKPADAALGKGGGGSKQVAKLEEKEKVEKKGEKRAFDGDIDDIFAAAPAKSKPDQEGEKTKKARGPDMEEVKAEAARFRGAGPKGGREYVDGVPIYSEKELEEEMGETAWENFLEAAEPGLS